MTSTKAHSHVNIQMIHRQPFAGAANPLRIGPNTGRQTPNDPQIQIPYARRAGSYII